MSTNAGSLRRTRPGVPSSTQLRVARATPNIKALLPFYCDGLGFEVVSSFVDHEDFDGIMLALPGTSSYHLEFTCTTRGLAEEQLRPPSPESLLVFYLPDDINYQYACDRMQRLGFAPVKSFNPYWDRCGKTFEDPDGYRMVLANADWKPDA